MITRIMCNFRATMASFTLTQNRPRSTRLNCNIFDHTLNIVHYAHELLMKYPEDDSEMNSEPSIICSWRIVQVFVPQFDLLFFALSTRLLILRHS